MCTGNSTFCAGCGTGLAQHGLAVRVVGPDRLSAGYVLSSSCKPKNILGIAFARSQ